MPGLNYLYRLKLMFDWGGGCLWCGNSAATDRFGVGPVEESLPLSPNLLDKLDRLSQWHDKALSWADPTGPSPWSAEDFLRFDQAVHSLLVELQSELGQEFEVYYVSLG